MKGFTTEIISADISMNEEHVLLFAEKLKEMFDAKITTDGNYVFMYMELKNLAFTYFPQTRYEPEEFDCDEWIYAEDLEDDLNGIAQELNIEIDIEKINCEEKEQGHE